MPALVSLLTVALAGAGPDAAPLSPTADHAAIHAEIVAGDPKFTATPIPLERLVAATELAEEKLHQATDADDAYDLLTLTAHGRKAAYRRTNEPLHLCRLITAANLVLARESVAPNLSTSATDFRQESLGVLGATSCEEKPPTEQSGSPPPTDLKATPDIVAAAPSEPAERSSVRPPARPDRRLRAGLGTLIPGLAMFAPVAGLLAYRVDVRGDLADLNATTMTRPATDAEILQAAALHDRFTVTTAAAAVLGVTGGALVVTGAVLLAVKRRPTRAALMPWGGRGVGGLVLQGRF